MRAKKSEACPSFARDTLQRTGHQRPARVLRTILRMVRGACVLVTGEITSCLTQRTQSSCGGSGCGLSWSAHAVVPTAFAKAPSAANRRYDLRDMFFPFWPGARKLAGMAALRRTTDHARWCGRPCRAFVRRV